MKKLILLLAVFMMMPLQAFAFRDYMIISDSFVKDVSIRDKNIATVEPLKTIDNAKKVIFVTPKKIGNTKIVVQLMQSIVELDVEVSENETFITPHDGFVVIPTDLPGAGLGKHN